MSDLKHILWVEKYRPQVIDDCILPGDMKQSFKNIIATGEIPNLLLVGPKGSGKTTVAKALVGALGSEYLMVNGTKDGDIDTLRTKIQPFADTASLEGGRKYVILDEADYLSYKTQPALRAFIEEVSKNCGFILTANYLNKIIEPLQSRCALVDFTIPKIEQPKMALEFFKRVKYILELENVNYDKDSLVSFVHCYFPDYRRILNEMQFYSNGHGAILQSVVESRDTAFTDLLLHLRGKDITKTRQWIADNLDNDPWTWFDLFYQNCAEHFDKSFIPALIESLADYQEKSTRVYNQEINMAAFLLVVMVNAVWKK